MFDTVLVANRGEIAVRVIRTLRALGIRSVAVYSDADSGARHVLEADEALRIGPALATESYLCGARVVDAALRSGAQAVHPGYGFLSENAAFAAAVADAGLVFIGPPPSAIAAMGDKIRAKERAAAAGVPVVPGAGQAGMPDLDLIAALSGIEYPLLIKPSAGGGGKGMRLVQRADELPSALAAARRTARAAFGDDTLLVEHFVSQPRHIEIQVLADSFGHVVHLGERECSLQRRHQKIIEEAPSPLLSLVQREAMGAAAVAAARSVGYQSTGTVEFIVSGACPDDYFFMEMNTRLQVEHPVTELVTGLDLVEWQLRVAAGEALAFAQTDVSLTGHAMEARVYAEDPARGFLPTGGTVLALREPSGGSVRVDSALAVGTVVGSDYDPMLAKVIAYGADRATARRRLDSALASTVILGLTTNVEYLRALLGDADVIAGRLDTGLAERIVFPAEPAAGSGAVADPVDVEHAGTGPADTGPADTGPADTGPAASVVVAPPEEVLAAAALDRLMAREPSGAVVNPWDLPDGWRVAEPAWTVVRVGYAPGAVATVKVRGLASSGAEVVVGEGAPMEARATAVDASAGLRGSAGLTGAAGAVGTLIVTYGGNTRRYACARVPGAPGDGHDGVLWLSRDGRTWALSAQRAVRALGGAGAAGSGDGVVRAPMPGTVVTVHVSVGQPVAAGQALVIVEAMKMEHTVTAPVDGVVTELSAKAGQQVRIDETLAVIGPQAAEGGS
jgi:acetyl-CoA/propionyl-CoA carboxylase, biotin carboxylase, biotin carboxyl carrier protein